MKRYVLLAVLLLFNASAKADNSKMVARDQAGNSVTLQSEKCVAAPWLVDWMTAVFIYQGKQYAACWKIQAGTVVILDSGGDVTSLPMDAFRPEQTI